MPSKSKAKPKAKPAAKKKKAAPASKKKKETVAPFKIDDLGDEVRLSFFDWTWLEKTHGSIELDGYYLNGPGVEGLVHAVMFANKISSADVEPNSEGDCCILNFPSVASATRVGVLAAAMIKDRAKLAKMIAIAQEQGFED